MEYWQPTSVPPANWHFPRVHWGYFLDCACLVSWWLTVHPSGRRGVAPYCSLGNKNDCVLRDLLPVSSSTVQHTEKCVAVSWMKCCVFMLRRQLSTHVIHNILVILFSEGTPIFHILLVFHFHSTRFHPDIWSCRKKSWTLIMVLTPERQNKD